MQGQGGSKEENSLDSQPAKVAVPFLGLKRQKTSFNLKEIDAKEIQLLQDKGISG
jgi:hypothetical protein